MRFGTLEIILLNAHFAEPAGLADLVANQTPEYMGGWAPFAGVDLRQAIARPGQDRYWGMMRHGQMIGAFWLTDWASGSPAFGVLIDSAHAGQGLATVATHMALATARLNGARLVTLQSNERGVSFWRRFGFELVGLAPDHAIMVCDVSRPAGRPAEPVAVDTIKAVILKKYGFTVTDDYARDLIRFVEVLKWPTMQI